MVKKPNTAHDDCRIHYRDIGDYLSREQKLEALKEAGAISGISEWQTITPDVHYDWIGQRSKSFGRFYKMGSKSSKEGKADDTVFKLFSYGYLTGRDPYIYNFSRDACSQNALRMTESYLAALSEIEQNPELTPDEAAQRHSEDIIWDEELKDHIGRRKKLDLKPSTSEALPIDPSSARIVTRITPLHTAGTRCLESSQTA